MKLLLIYLSYTIIILIICYLFEVFRYRLFLGYLTGTILGLLLLFYVNLEIAIAVSIFVGFVSIVKMLIHR